MAQVFSDGHAVLVGVGADLPGTVNDAVGIADILKEPGRCAYPAGQVDLLTSEDATRDQILAALDRLRERATSDSTAVVYFSGHGTRADVADGQSHFYLLPFGYDVTRLGETAISGAEFTECLRQISARKLLVLLDCCHAGSLEGSAKAPGSLHLIKAPLPPEATTLLAQGSGRLVIASCKEGELSYAGTPYSAFTLALIEALSGIGAAVEDGYVRVADLALHAREMVPAWTQDRQHPILNFGVADNFLLAYYAGGDAKPKGLPFATNPEIEPLPGAWKDRIQQGQGAQAPQANVAGPMQGSVAAGTIQGPVHTGRGDIIQTQSGAIFNQKDWRVGTVNQFQGDLTAVQGSGVVNTRPVAQAFKDLRWRLQSLPTEEREEVMPIVHKAEGLVEKVQAGVSSPQDHEALQGRLFALTSIVPGMTEGFLLDLAERSDAVPVLRTIAQKIQQRSNN